MIEIRVIDESCKNDVRLTNKPFPIYGKMLPGFSDGQWSATVTYYDVREEMCFPEESYDFDKMKHSFHFIGAYDNGVCIGLAVLQIPTFRYLYLYDLKVDPAFRHRGIGGMLIRESAALAKEAGYRGLYTIGQDNNLAACMFYLKQGFRIGGYDTEVYNGTSQAGKADIYFYLDL